jgi:hypothetical protein
LAGSSRPNLKPIFCIKKGTGAALVTQFWDNDRKSQQITLKIGQLNVAIVPMVASVVVMIVLAPLK